MSETAVRVLAPIPGSSKVKALAVFGDVPSRGGGVVNILYVGGAHYDAITVHGEAGRESAVAACQGSPRGVGDTTACAARFTRLGILADKRRGSTAQAALVALSGSSDSRRRQCRGDGADVGDGVLEEAVSL